MARHPGLDALRGLLIILVIIGHFPTSARGLNPFGPVPEFIYFFHIPLFLALSCLFAKPLTRTQLGQRALQLLVPYALWVALTHPWRLLHQPWELLRDAAMGNYAHMPSILWFLPALFTTNLLVGLWRQDWPASPPTGFRVRLALVVAAAAAFAGAPRLAQWHAHVPFGLDVALFLLPFIGAMDLLWRRCAGMERGTGSASSRPAAIATALACLAFPVGAALIQGFERVKTHSAYARRVDFAQFSVPETLPGYLGLVLMGAALVVLASRLPAPRWLAAIGRYSMPIFVLHYLLLFALTRSIGMAGESRGWLLAYAGLVTALVIALAMLGARLLSRLSPRFALLGLQAPDQ